MPIVLKIRRKAGCDDLPLPRYMSAAAAGMDLRAANEAPVEVAPGQVHLVPTGLYVAIPAGYEGQVRPRSGLALKHGLVVVNSPGTIDSDYRGEIQVILMNTSSEGFTVRRGDRIAQLVVAPVADAVFEEGEALDETARGAGGFGHTGTAVTAKADDS